MNLNLEAELPWLEVSFFSSFRTGEMDPTSKDGLDEGVVSIWVFSGGSDWTRSGIMDVSLSPPSDQLARLNAWFSYPFHRSGSYR